MAMLSEHAVRPLRTLDPDMSLDDLDWLDEAVGDARVVAIGESAHYNGESYRLRHRLLRRLVERHGFRTYAMETGFVEGWLTDDWIRGDPPEDLGEVLATGITSLMGLWREMRAQLEWMRATGSVRFAGIDLGGSNASLLPGLDATLAYLATADPEFSPSQSLRQTAAGFSASSAFSAPASLAAYGSLGTERRDALTAGLAELHTRMTGRRLEYVRRTTNEAYDRALRALRLTIALDGVARDLRRADYAGMMHTREAAIADTVEWILHRHGRIVLAAHNGHLQRWPGALPGIPATATLGLHLADRLGGDYLVIGTTTGSGQTLTTSPDFYAGKLFSDLEPPRPGSLDALMEANSGGNPVAVDLRRLSAGDTDIVRAAGQQRFGSFYADLDPSTAYDLVVHLPRVTAAEPDPAAVASSPPEVREAFARWATR